MKIKLLDNDFKTWTSLKPGLLFRSVDVITATWPPEEKTTRDEFGFPICIYFTVLPTDLCLVISIKKSITTFYNEQNERLDIVFLTRSQLCWTRIETNDFSFFFNLY